MQRELSVGLVVLAVTISLPGYGWQQPPRSVEETARLVERGKVVYAEQKCQACHSIGQVGNRRNPLDGVGTRLEEEDVRKWITAPREMNPRVSKRAYTLPAADLEALVVYLMQLPPPAASR